MRNQPNYSMRGNQNTGTGMDPDKTESYYKNMNKFYGAKSVQQKTRKQFSQPGESFYKAEKQFYGLGGNTERRPPSNQRRISSR